MRKEQIGTATMRGASKERDRDNPKSFKLFDRMRMWRAVSVLGTFSLMLLVHSVAHAQLPHVRSARLSENRPVIDFQRRATTLSIPIVGVPFRLNYRSDALAPKWRWSVYHAYDPGSGVFSPGNGWPRVVSPLFQQSAKPPAWLGVGEMAIAAQDGSEIYIFNQRGDHLRTLNALTGALVYRFDYASGVLTTITDAYGNATKIERNAAGFMTAVVAPHGQRTTFSNNEKGYPTRITDPLGEAISLDYSPDGQLAVFTDANKNTHHFTTDHTGSVTKLQGPDGGFVELTGTRTENDAKLSWNTSMSRQSAWAAQRTPDGAISAVSTDPAGSQTQIQVTGETSKIAYPDGRTITRARQPDPRWGRQSSVLKTFSLVMPSGLTAVLSANRTVTLADTSNPLDLTNLTETASVNGRSYKRILDAKSREITQVTPAGRRVVTTLDEHGQAVRVEVPGLLPVSLIYNSQGRLTSLTQGDGAESRIASADYNPAGSIASVTDPLKRAVRFEYDGAGRVIKRILPDGSDLVLKYDSTGNLTSITPPGRPPHSFQYTAIGTISAYVPPTIDRGVGKQGVWNSITSFLAHLWRSIKSLFRSRKAAAPAQDELAPGDKAYQYNADGQLTKVLQPSGSNVEFEYDTGGRLTGVNGSGAAVRFGYDPTTAKLVTITALDGGTVTHTYDGSLLTREAWTGRVSGVVAFTYDDNLRTLSTSVDDATPVKLEYDADGLLTRTGDLNLTRDTSNGLLTKTSLGNVTTAEEYNGFGEPAVRRATYKNQEIFADHFVRDALGRIVQKTETMDRQSTVYTYTYDLAGRLTDVIVNGTPTAHYEYDRNGNRISYTGPRGSIRASYDDQDRIGEYGSATYVHTANGEWLNKTADGKTTTYSYDRFGNLKAVSLPDSTKVEYVVDGANRRIGKRINGTLTEGFLYQDQLKVIAELNPKNEVVSRFVYGTQPNIPDYMTKAGKIYRIVADHLGSPRIVIDADTGTVAQRMDYDEFGNVLRDTNPGFQPFGFAGGIYDQHTHLIRFGARDYDPSTGRWTAKDPVLISVGSTQTYEYCLGDVVNFIDPSGFWTVGAGVSGSVGAGSGGIGLIGVGSLGVAIDGQGGSGIVITVGGGGGVAEGDSGVIGSVISGGVSLSGSNGKTVGDLSDWFEQGGLGAGPFSAEGFTGPSDHGQVTGASFSAGVGEGAAGWAGKTYTWVIPMPTYSFDDPLSSVAADLWHCYGPGNLFGFGDASGCGSGTGDIHMATFDGLRYDLQAAGEFVASQDPTGKNKIQIRMEPNQAHTVSYCTAVAASVDGVKVAIHLKPQPQVYVDGKPIKIELGRGMRLGNAGEIRVTDASEWIINWPDNTGVRVKPQGSYLDVVFRPGSSAGKLVGLLGNADGNSTGDLVTRDGIALETGFTSKDLYGRFAESWRITQNESLFHYNKGESTATFTDRTVPRQNVTVETLDPAARAEAERQCRAAGITAPAALSNCIIDFAVTGDRRFLASAALAQAVSIEATAVRTVGPNPTSGSSSLRLDVPQDLLQGLNRWQVIRFGNPSQVVVDLDRDHRSTILPPGDYQIASLSQGTGNWVAWPQKVQVQPGQQTTVSISSSLRLDVPQDLLQGLNRWQVVRFGNPSQVVVDLDRDHRSTILPPGDYQIASLAQGTGDWVIWPPRVALSVGAAAVSKLDSGIRLVGPGAARNYHFQLTDTTGRTVESWQGSTVQLFPPGKYSVQARSDEVPEWKRVGANIEVRPGSFTEINVPVLPKSADQGNSGFHH